MTIPVSFYVNVSLGVIPSTPIDSGISGLLLIKDTVLIKNEFFGITDVAAEFGTSSDAYKFASKYFAGYDGSTVKPARIFMSTYASADTAAVLFSGSFEGIPIAEIITAAGVLTVNVSGVPITSAAIDLTGDVSHIGVAATITAAFAATASPLVCSWDPQSFRFKLSTPTLGAAVTISTATGTAADDLKFSEATGGVGRPGLATHTAASAISYAASLGQWSLFSYLPAFSNTEVVELGKVAAVDFNYELVAFDNVVTATDTATELNLAFLLKANGCNTTLVVYNPVVGTSSPFEVAAVAMGMQCSLDLTQENGLQTIAHRTQSGVSAESTITSVTDASALVTNGYTYYGRTEIGSASSSRMFDGALIGKKNLSIAYADQLMGIHYLRRVIGTTLFTMIGVTSIPMTPSGITSIRTSLESIATQAILVGVIQPLLTKTSLDAAHISAITNTFGANSTAVLDSIVKYGYYIQVPIPTGADIASRRVTAKFWYTAGGFIHTINVSVTGII